MNRLQASSPPPQPTQLPPQAAQGGLDFTNNWGLCFLAGGLFMGLIALFIGWTNVAISSSQDVSANGIDWITGIDWFDDDGFPWWLGFLALLSFIGVGLLGLTFFKKVVPGSPVPDAPGIGVLGALMLALSPLFTHVGFLLWVASEFHLDAGEVWDFVWRTDGAGIWLALAAGIIAFIGTAAIYKRGGRSF